MSQPTYSGAEANVQMAKVDPYVVQCVYPGAGVNARVPDGTVKSSIVRSYEMVSNIEINNEDLMIIVKPYQPDQVQGYILSYGAQDDHWNYVAPIKLPVDVTQFSAMRVCNSMHSIFSDTIATGATTLSGRMTSLILHQLPSTQLPSYSTLPALVSDDRLKMVNSSLADGHTIVPMPQFSQLLQRKLGAMFWADSGDDVQAQYQGKAAPVDLGLNTGNPYLDKLGDNLQLAKISTSANPFFANGFLLRFNGMLTSHKDQPSSYEMGSMVPFALVKGYTAEGQLISSYFTGASQGVSLAHAGNGDQVSSGQWELRCTPRNLMGSEDIDAYFQATEIIFGVHSDWQFNLAECGGNYSITCIDPILCDDGSPRCVTWIQGSLGSKNINIAGKCVMEVIPQAGLASVVKTSMPCAATFLGLETVLTLYDQNYLSCVYNRNLYADRVQQLLEQGPAIHNAAMGMAASEMGFASGLGALGTLAGLWRGGVRLLKKAGINPASLARKIVTPLTGTIHRAIDMAEERGYAADDLHADLSGIDGVPSKVPVGFSSSSSSIGYCSQEAEDVTADMGDLGSEDGDEEPVVQAPAPQPTPAATPAGTAESRQTEACDRARFPFDTRSAESIRLPKFTPKEMNESKDQWEYNAEEVRQALMSAAYHMSGGQLASMVDCPSFVRASSFVALDSASAHGDVCQVFVSSYPMLPPECYRNVREEDQASTTAFQVSRNWVSSEITMPALLILCHSGQMTNAGRHAIHSANGQVSNTESRPVYITLTTQTFRQLTDFSWAAAFQAASSPAQHNPFCLVEGVLKMTMIGPVAFPRYVPVGGAGDKFTAAKNDFDAGTSGWAAAQKAIGVPMTSMWVFEYHQPTWPDTKKAFASILRYVQREGSSGHVVSTYADGIRSTLPNPAWSMYLSAGDALDFSQTSSFYSTTLSVQQMFVRASQVLIYQTVGARQKGVAHHKGTMTAQADDGTTITYIPLGPESKSPTPFDKWFSSFRKEGLVTKSMGAYGLSRAEAERAVQKVWGDHPDTWRAIAGPDNYIFTKGHISAAIQWDSIRTKIMVAAGKEASIKKKRATKGGAAIGATSRLLSNANAAASAAGGRLGKGDTFEVQDLGDMDV